MLVLVVMRMERVVMLLLHLKRCYMPAQNNMKQDVAAQKGHNGYKNIDWERLRPEAMQKSPYCHGCDSLSEARSDHQRHSAPAIPGWEKVM